jgi:hypothetical protein
MIGYFTEAAQTEPVFDPGLEVDCPVCKARLIEPVKTISLMWVDGDRSYFFRAHKACWERLTPEEQGFYEGAVLDAMCKCEFEWVGGHGTPYGPTEPELVCKHCGAIKQED